MKRGKTIIGMPVVSLETGEQVGRVIDLMVDPPKKRICGLLLERCGWLRTGKAIALQKIYSFGEDAITINSEDAIESVKQLHNSGELYRDNESYLNMHLLTESGKDLGVIEDIIFEEQSGAISGYEVSNGLLQDLFEGRVKIPCPESLTIGKESIIVPDYIEFFFQKAEEPDKAFPHQIPDFEEDEEITEGEIENNPDELTDW